MNRYALIDLKHPTEGLANRDQTGSFGSYMKSGGLVGKLIGSLKKTGNVIPNLSLAYLRAIALKEGHQATVYEGMPQGEEWVLIATSMHHFALERELAEQIRQAYPQSKIGFINAFATTNPEEFEDIADFIILGEPEWAFWQHCRGELELEGRVESEMRQDLDELPFPAWSKEGLSQYGYFPALPRRPFLTIQGSRGCPYGCPFCPYLVLQGVPLRRRKNEKVLEELQYLKAEFGVKSVLFRDITFSYDLKGTKELLNLIAAADLDIEFGCETRPDKIDDELIDLFKQARFKVVNLGIESPNGEILKASGRRSLKSDKIRSIVDRLEKAGVQVQAFYILGLDEDTPNSMAETLAYSRALNSFTAQYCVMTPFPGTGYYDELDKGRLLTQDWSRFTEYEPVVDIPGASPEEVLAFRDQAFRGYYLRPRWVARHGFKVARRMLANLLNS